MAPLWRTQFRNGPADGHATVTAHPFATWWAARSATQRATPASVGWATCRTTGITDRLAPDTPPFEWAERLRKRIPRRVICPVHSTRPVSARVHLPRGASSVRAAQAGA